MKRFRNVQETGIRKEKESLERARTATYQSPDGIDFQSGAGVSASYQQQQQQQQNDLQGINQRAEHLRELEVKK